MDNTNKTENTTQDKKGWNWMAFFFGGFYYMGYGDLKRALIFTGISILIPGSNLFVNIYAALKANDYLPVGRATFNMKNAFYLLGAALLVSSLWLTILASMIGGVPSCGSSAAEDALDRIAIEYSSLDVLELKDVKEVIYNSDKDIRVCSATIVTVEGPEKVKYSIELNEDGIPYVHIR